MRKKESLISRRFTKLIVIAPAEPDNRNKKRWLCKCDCGNEKIIYEQSLCRGATKSCGCYNKEVSRKRMSKGWSDIFTERFLQKEYIENKKSLREIAKEKGCTIGCIVKYMKKNKLEVNDPFHKIAGQKFGMLTVTDMAFTKNGDSHWNVKCDCGNTKIVCGKSLVRHKIVSCGCYNKNKCWKGIGDLSKTYWSRLIKNATERSLEFEINMEYAWNLFLMQNKKCALSGRDIALDRQWSANHKYRRSIQTASLDRIDSTRGYCIGNVQWVHITINKMKSNLDEIDFIQWCKDIVYHKR